jgi:hypothetical protein
MAFNINHPGFIGVHAPGNPQPVAELVPGTILHCNDPVQGSGEFIYLQGVANTVAGSVVVYDTRANTTTLAVTGSRGSVAVAMSANGAGSFDFYQIGGAAVVKETGATANGRPYVTATAGQASVTVSATNAIDGMTFTAADGAAGLSAGFAFAELDRPSLNGNG